MFHSAVSIAAVILCSVLGAVEGLVACPFRRRVWCWWWGKLLDFIGRLATFGRIGTLPICFSRENC